MPNFIFLEITDPEVNALISEIRTILRGTPLRRQAHLTVRGPYSGDVPREVLEKCRHAMSHDVLRIWGVGRFSNPEEEVVFLKVESSHLREIWWKPDYPIGEVGFNPHISVYRGRDARFADAAAEGLAASPIDILCAEFRLVDSRPAQVDAFLDMTWRRDHLQRFIRTGSVQPGLLTNLERLAQDMAG